MTPGCHLRGHGPESWRGATELPFPLSLDGGFVVSPESTSNDCMRVFERRVLGVAVKRENPNRLRRSRKKCYSGLFGGASRPTWSPFCPDAFFPTSSHATITRNWSSGVCSAFGLGRVGNHNQAWDWIEPPTDAGLGPRSLEADRYPPGWYWAHPADPHSKPRPLELWLPSAVRSAGHPRSHCVYN